MQDVKRYSGRFNKPQVDKIIKNLKTATPLTVYAPSGFGKSRVLTYISFNRRYRKFKWKLRNTYFAYLDATDIAVQSLDGAQQPSHRDPSTAAKYHREVIETKFLEALKAMCKHHNFAYSKDETDLFALLDKLVDNNPRMRIYLILDGIEKLFADKFRTRRDTIKFLRDKYRGNLEYIFGMSDAKYIDEIDTNLGELSKLLAQKFISLPLIDSGMAEYLHFSTGRIHRYLHKIWIRIDRSLSARFKLIDRISGGYPPYVKYLLSLDKRELAELGLSKELEIGSKRLIKSLHPKQQIYMKKVMQDPGFHQNDLYFTLLKELRIIRNYENSQKLFSQIMYWFLKG